MLAGTPKTMVFKVQRHKDQSGSSLKVDLLESYIDGVNLTYLLGFRVGEVVYGEKKNKTTGIYFPDDKLEELKTFVKDYRKKGR